MDYSKRRPLSEALHLALSEEALTFVTGTPPPAVMEPPSAATEKTSAANVSALNPPAPPVHPTSMTLKSPPHLSVVLPAIVSMTFRLPAPVVARLARVAAERKLQRERPFSQQDIVAVALEEWLQRHGYPG